MMNTDSAQSMAYAKTAAAPREAGVLARLDSLADGLHGLHQKLLHFGERLAGGTQKDTNPGPNYPPGISSALSAAEARLRECHELVEALHKAF